MTAKLFVTKASGRSEPFSMLKLRRSLERAKASKSEIDSIINKLTPRLYNGINTKKIYSEAFRLLKHFSKPMAARYQIKKAIMELGPSGFPFEKFIAKVFEQQGYTTLTGQFVKGKCVSHEIDVIARKGNEIILAECKYRNTSGITVDVKTPLYIRSRFNDVLENGEFKKPKEIISGWVITNSKFTGDAVTYGSCAGLNLLSWDYPVNNALKDLIDRFGLYPLTCLTSLSKQEKQWLLSQNYVMAKDVFSNNEILKKAGVSTKRFEEVKNEGKRLTQNIENNI